MIFIQKPTEDPDISVYKEKRWNGLNGKTTLAKRDLEKAIAHYANPANFNNNEKFTRKKFSFEAYSHEDTKKELNDIFKGKCAYCESFIMHTEPGDIEHFRPKAEIHTKDRKVLKPGYYWLGGDWNNLLLSCIKCNRSNNQAVNVRDGDVQNMGKANHFPLSDESRRIRSHTQNIELEDAFVEIINPCVDIPNDHLVFEDNGQLTALDSKGENSIEVYGLFRADLVLKRSRIAKELQQTLITLTLAVQLLEGNINNGLPTENNISLIEIQKETLESCFNEEAEYLGLKRQKLERFKTQNPISYQKLIDLGIDLDGFL